MNILTSCIRLGTFTNANFQENVLLNKSCFLVHIWFRFAFLCLSAFSLLVVLGTFSFVFWLLSLHDFILSPGSVYFYNLHFVLFLPSCVFSVKYAYLFSCFNCFPFQFVSLLSLMLWIQFYMPSRVFSISFSCPPRCLLFPLITLYLFSQFVLVLCHVLPHSPWFCVFKRCVSLVFGCLVSTQSLFCILFNFSIKAVSRVLHSCPPFACYIAAGLHNVINNSESL